MIQNASVAYDAYVKTLAALSLALCLGLAGCVVGYVNRDLPVSPLHVSAWMQYRGFSIARPTSSAWYVTVSEQSSTHAILRRRVRGKTHTAFASADLKVLPRIAISPADFAQLCRSDHIIETNRLALISYDQHLSTVQGQWAIEYSMTVLDAHARNSLHAPLTIRTIGRVVNQPAFPNSVVAMIYSERGRPEELDPDLETKGREILNGIVLESEPGKPL